jgi:sulfopyruvate decarboxylase subunit beta
MLTRLEALKIIAAAYATDPIVVTLGTTARELAAVARGQNHLYVLDSMGLPPAIGVGLALGLADSRFDKCVVIEGDGSLLMGLNTLATVGVVKPKKLFLIVLDNGIYAATGGQATASRSVDLVGIARACGMATLQGSDAETLSAALEDARAKDGPLFLHVPIGPENAPTPFLLEDPVMLGASFKSFLDQNR